MPADKPPAASTKDHVSGESLTAVVSEKTPLREEPARKFPTTDASGASADAFAATMSTTRLDTGVKVAEQPTGSPLGGGPLVMNGQPPPAQDSPRTLMGSSGVAHNRAAAYALTPPGPELGDRHGVGQMAALRVMHESEKEKAVVSLRAAAAMIAALCVLSPPVHWLIARVASGDVGEAGGLCAALLLNAVAVAALAVAVTRLRRDLQRLQNRCTDIRTLKKTITNDERAADSAISEVRSVEAAFTALARAVESYRKFVPTSMVQQLDSDESDTESEEDLVDPPSGDPHVTIVFTDIQSSTRLWEAVPVQMNTALSIHNSEIRRALRSNGGYEVKTIGDAFMCSFADPVAAVRFCLGVQSALVDKKWPRELAGCPDAAQEDGKDGGRLWAGLRVRIGAHMGPAIVEENPLTERADYRGPTVNKAARVEAQGQGGMVIVTKELYDACSSNFAALPSELRPHTKDVGTRSLKGVSEPVHLIVLLPNRLADRIKSWGIKPAAPAGASGAGGQRRGSRKMVHVMTPDGLVEMPSDEPGARQALVSPPQLPGVPESAESAAAPAAAKRRADMKQPTPQRDAPNSNGAGMCAEDLQAFGLPPDMESPPLSNPSESPVQPQARPKPSAIGSAISSVASSSPEVTTGSWQALRKTFSHGRMGVAPAARKGARNRGETVRERKKQKRASLPDVPQFLRVSRGASTVLWLRIRDQVNVDGTETGEQPTVSLNPQHVTTSLNEITAVVVCESARSEGVLETGHGDSMIVSWNLDRDVLYHQSQALRFCTTCSPRISALTDAGVCTGDMMYGAIGTQEQAFRCLIGGATRLASACADHAGALGTFCLCADSAGDFRATPPRFAREMRCVDVWRDAAGRLLQIREPDLETLAETEEDDGLWSCVQQAPGSPRAARLGSPRTPALGGDAPESPHSERGPRQYPPAAQGSDCVAALRGDDRALQRLRRAAEERRDVALHRAAALISEHRELHPQGRAWRVEVPWRTRPRIAAPSPVPLPAGVPPSLPPAKVAGALPPLTAAQTGGGGSARPSAAAPDTPPQVACPC